MDKENNNSNSYMDQKEYNDRMIKMMIEQKKFISSSRINEIKDKEILVKSKKKLRKRGEERLLRPKEMDKKIEKDKVEFTNPDNVI